MSADIHNADIDIADNAAADRYEVRIDGRVIGRADYRREGDRVTIPHTQIDPAHGGQGLGGRMVRYALDDIRRQGLKVVPACPFVSDYIAKHPEYNDLL
jgi:predicted GNAT family acetyltransferase